MEQRIFSFGIKEQLMVMLQNVNDVNKERACLAAASSVCSFGIKELRMVMLQNVNDVNKERTRLAAASSVCLTRPNIMVS